MASLNFKGKSAVWNHHLSVPFHTLDEDKKFSLKGDNANDNLIIEGDNLLALKALLPKYQGKIKCIYIDPPYNTGNEGWVYNDKVNAPQIKEWYKTTVGKEGEDLTRHDKWLSMMTPRLKMLRELLSTDGVIFISIDDNEQHHLRQLMDEIFGEENFISVFMWKRKKEISSDSKNIAIQGEYIICYSKTQLFSLNFEELSKEYLDSSYNKPTKEFPDSIWRPVPLTVSKGLSGGGYEYEIITPSGKVHKRLWAYPKTSYEKLLEKKRVYFGKDNNGIPQRVVYDFESSGKPVSNFWENVATNKEGKKEILDIFSDDLFSTPKPIALVKKILTLSTNKDDIILDSFAGSGTTAHAVMAQNKEDGGNRKFILVEMEDYANSITAERVRRAIKRDGYKAGFTYYKLGPAIDAETMLSGDLPGYKQFAKYVYYLATGKDHPEEGKIDEASYFVGKADHDTIHLVYKQDLETLKSMAITLDWAEKTHKKDGGHKIVYAPACYLDEEALDKYQIKFVSIPYNLFERNEL